MCKQRIVLTNSTAATKVSFFFECGTRKKFIEESHLCLNIQRCCCSFLPAAFVSQETLFDLLPLFCMTGIRTGGLPDINILFTTMNKILQLYFNFRIITHFYQKKLKNSDLNLPGPSHSEENKSDLTQTVLLESIWSKEHEGFQSIC